MGALGININMKYDILVQQLLTEAKKDPSLSIKRGEKLPASKGAGLTAKGRAK